MTEWSDDIEKLLSEVRENCITLNKYHLRRYYKYKQSLPFFKMPVLILSAVNSVFSVGLQPYMEQSLISVLNCIVSLVITLINSIELYMGIQKSMESEMLSSQGYYILSIDIYKTISLQRDHRDTAGKQYLTECYNKYQELIKKSKLINDTTLPDMLQSINNQMITMYNIDDKCVSIQRLGIQGLDTYNYDYDKKDMIYYGLTDDAVDGGDSGNDDANDQGGNIKLSDSVTKDVIVDDDIESNNKGVNKVVNKVVNNNNISEDDELLFPRDV
jgi:hypothetical protein